jgi:outer membrane immunogenic protein
MTYLNWISRFWLSIFFAGLIGTPAFAADMAVKMPVKAPPPAPAPVDSWTGFYVGGDIGGARMNDPNFSFADLGNAAVNTCAFCGGPYSSPTLSGGHNTGAIGGVFGDFNWQFSPQWVAGVEGDITWTNLKASASGQLFDNEPA